MTLSALLMAAQHSHSQAPGGRAGFPTPGAPKKNPPVAGAAVVAGVVLAGTVADPKVKKEGVAVVGVLAGTVVVPKVKLVDCVAGAAVVVVPKVKVVGCVAGAAVAAGVSVGESGAEATKNAGLEAAVVDGGAAIVGAARARVKSMVITGLISSVLVDGSVSLRSGASASSGSATFFAAPFFPPFLAAGAFFPPFFALGLVAATSSEVVGSVVAWSSFLIL
jgi:hypothetical protein